jgi:hypothetical protein
MKNLCHSSLALELGRIPRSLTDVFVSARRSVRRRKTNFGILPQQSRQSKPFGAREAGFFARKT